MIRLIAPVIFWFLAALFMLSLFSGPSLEQIQREDAERAAKIEREWQEIKRSRGL